MIRRNIMATKLKVNQHVKFDYTKKDGSKIVVPTLFVDRVYTSQDGYDIVTGYLDENGDEARSYRADNIENVEVV
jgi:hypothetical protein